MATTLGTLISAAGYALAIWGGIVLFLNTAPETGIGRIPMFNGDGQEFFRGQDEAIVRRRSGSRFGFGLLTIGSTLQLVGTLVAGLLG